MSSDTKTHTHISRADLLRQIQSGAAPLIIDVRSTWEFKRGHVPGALNIPFLSTFFRHQQFPIARDAPIIVYCEHGPRAGIARFALRCAGFEQVRYLEGHMQRWRKDGLPIESAVA